MKNQKQKQKKKPEYYDYGPILSLNADINIIWGKRSSGKSYGIKKMILEDYLNHGLTGMIVRQFDDDWTATRRTYWNDMFDLIEKMTDGSYNGVIYYNTAWYLAKYEGSKVQREAMPFCYCGAVAMQERMKSGQYPNNHIIVYEEFIHDKMRFYLPDEPANFMNIVNTVDRQKGTAKVFLIANSTNVDNPFFDDYKIPECRKMRTGEIKKFIFNNKDGSKTILAAECTKSDLGGDDGNKYSSFMENAKADMITKGEWEIDCYPHLTEEYKYIPKEIKLQFFIKYKDNLFMGHLVKHNRMLYVFFAPKTTEIKDKEPILFSPDVVIDRKSYTNLLKCPYKYARLISELVTKGQALYSDNLTGEWIQNYLQWCRQN